MDGVADGVPKGATDGAAGVMVGSRVVVLGAGKVGSAVAMLLREAGFRVVAVTARTTATAEEAAARIRAAADTDSGPAAGTDNTAAAAQGDIVVVATNDDAIASVVAEVAVTGGFRPGQLVVHLSGALPLAVLDPARDVGALIGCLHPLQTFASAHDAVRTLPGSVFGVTSGPGAAARVEELVQALGGESVGIADADKALYHAAAVMASNYLVAVEDAAIHLLMRAGFDEPSALKALRPLVIGTTENIFRLGATSALTGPIARGDVATVRGHIEALSEPASGCLGRPPGDDSLTAHDDELSLYRALGRHTLGIARRRGTLTHEQDAALGKLLSD